jgi:DHA2 family multidrug resistance protein
MSEAATMPLPDTGHDPYPSKLARRAAERGWLKWAILISVSFGAILEVIDVSIINVAVPHMQGNLGASLEEIGWVATGYSTANVIIIPLTAWLGNRFGKKNYFIFSLFAFTVASMACGFAVNLHMLVWSRVVQGLGGGGLLAKAQAVMFETFPKEEQATASAVFGLGVIAGPTLGPVLGGWLTDTLSWRWIFFINLPFGILAIWMISMFMPKDEPHPDRENRVDWWGIGLLAAGLGCLQVVLEQGEQDDWFDSKFICRMMIISVVSLVAFVWHELRVKHPAVDLRVLRFPALTAGSLYSIVLGMGLYGTLYVVPIYAQTMLNYTATQTGILLIPGALAALVGIILSSRLLKFMDTRILIFMAAMGMVGTCLWLANLNPDTGSKELFGPLVLRGISSVFMFAPLAIATLGSLPKQYVAAGSGFYSLTRQMGGSIGIALIGTMVDKMTVVHRSELVWKISDFSSAYADRIRMYADNFIRNSGDPVAAKQQALALVDRIINQQAGLMAFIDVFYVMAAMFVLTIPLLIFLDSGKNKKNAAEAEALH